MNDCNRVKTKKVLLYCSPKAALTFHFYAELHENTRNKNKVMKKNEEMKRFGFCPKLYALLNSKINSRAFSLMLTDNLPP